MKEKNLLPILAVAIITTALLLSCKKGMLIGQESKSGNAVAEMIYPSNSPVKTSEARAMNTRGDAPPVGRQASSLEDGNKAIKDPRESEPIGIHFERPKDRPELPTPNEQWLNSQNEEVQRLVRKQKFFVRLKSDKWNLGVVTKDGHFVTWPESSLYDNPRSVPWVQQGSIPVFFEQTSTSNIR